MNIFSKAVIQVAFLLLIPSVKCLGQWALVQRADSAMPVTLIRNTRLGLFAYTSPQNQVFRSTDAGNTWQATYLANMSGVPFPTYSTISLSTIISTPKNVFAVDFLTRMVFNSSDSGKTWDILVDKTRPSSAILAEDIVAIDGTVIRLYQGSLFFSSDNGNSWRYNQELGRLASAKQINVVDNTLIITSIFGEVFQSKDLGASWKILPFAINERAILYFAGSAFLWKQQYNGTIGGFNSYTLTFSGDSGKSWIPFQISDSTNIIYQVTTIDQKLLVASWAGLYSSSDLGKSWRRESGKNGLGSGFTTSLDTAGGQIFVAVQNNIGGRRSLYRTTPSTVSTREEPPLLTFRSSPAPNPTSETASIAFTLPRPAQVALTLYSALGVEVWRSVSASYAAGEQHISVDTRGLPSGVYSYRLTAGGMHSVGRVVVVR
ncbi:MAG: T9SS type A sorting domain-containing protein [Candidatus Kapabacteria bacterium]|nr:T9SS type A sorting domain-containing protein [Candidatus Kapabacteria bacterium]